MLERHAKPDVFRPSRTRWKPFFLCPIPHVRDRATDASAMRPYLWNHRPMRPAPHVRDGQAPTFENKLCANLRKKSSLAGQGEKWAEKVKTRVKTGENGPKTG